MKLFPNPAVISHSRGKSLTPPSSLQRLFPLDQFTRKTGIVPCCPCQDRGNICIENGISLPPAQEFTDLCFPRIRSFLFPLCAWKGFSGLSMTRTRDRTELDHVQLAQDKTGFPTAMVGPSEWSTPGQGLQSIHGFVDSGMRGGSAHLSPELPWALLGFPISC